MLLCLCTPPKALTSSPLVAAPSHQSNIRSWLIAESRSTMYDLPKKVTRPIVIAMAMSLLSIHPQVTGLGVEGGACKSLLTTA